MLIISFAFASLALPFLYSFLRLMTKDGPSRKRSGKKYLYPVLKGIYMARCLENMEDVWSKAEKAKKGESRKRVISFYVCFGH